MNILKKISISWKDQAWSALVVLVFCALIVIFDQFMHTSQKLKINELNHKIYAKCMNDMNDEMDKSQLESSFKNCKNTQTEFNNTILDNKQFQKHKNLSDYTLLFVCDTNDSKSDLTKDMLTHSPVISNMINTQNTPSLQLIVVCRCNDVKNSHSDIEYPDNWIIIHNLEMTNKLQNGVTHNNIWLLDKYKRVILRNTSFKIAEQWLLAL